MERESILKILFILMALTALLVAVQGATEEFEIQAITNIFQNLI